MENTLNTPPHMPPPAVHQLTAPAAWLDSTGEVMDATASGLEQLDILKSLLGQVNHLDKSAIFQLRDCLGRSWPVFISVAGQQVKVSPCPDTKNLYLLEWQDNPQIDILNLMRAVTQAVNSSLVLEDIFEALGDVLKRYFAYRDATIVMLDNSQNGIQLLVRYDEAGNTDLSTEIHGFAGADALVDQLLKQPKPLQFNTETLPDSLVFLSGTKDALVVPLINKGLMTGLMAIASPWTHFFQPHHHTMLQEVSGQVAIAVENAKLYWQTQSQAGRAFLINQITASIRQSLQIDDILSTAVNEVGRVTGVSRCFIQYGTNETHSPQLYQYCLTGIPPLTQATLTEHPLEHRVYSQRRQTLGDVALTDLTVKRVQEMFNPFILNHIQDCPPFLEAEPFLTSHQVKSLAIFPILLGNDLVGTLTLHQCNTYRSWLPEDIDLMRAITDHLGVALHQARLFGEIDTQKNELAQALDELKLAQLQLVQSEKMAVIGQFVAGIAHEVNTPLGTIQGNTETLQTCLKKLAQNPTDTETTTRLSQTMDQLLSLNHMAGERIQEIVRSLRNFARLDESELKPTDITEGIDSTLLLLKNELTKQGITVTTQYTTPLPFVQCYPGLLNQVFMNLLVNAIHAMSLPDTPLDLTDTEAQPSPTISTDKTITVRVFSEDDWLIITVADTGKGIAPEHLAKIFDPGFTTKGVGVGTGLGLSLCYKIVEKHHGQISVTSTVDQGTTFSVKIPL